jgi:hypothetical protein
MPYAVAYVTDAGNRVYWRATGIYSLRATEAWVGSEDEAKARLEHVRAGSFYPTSFQVVEVPP